jgi:mannosylfructose-phosphate synthase
MLQPNSKKLNRVCLLNPQGYVQYPPPLGKTDTGGQTLYILQLAKALGKKNIKVDIITRQFESMDQEEDLFENVRIVRIPCGSKNFVAKEKLYELMPEMMENFMLYIEKTRKKYDVIHSHYWDGGYAGILLSKMLDIPHVHTPHSLGKAKKMEMSVEDLPPQKLKPAYRYHVRIAIEQKIMNKAQAVVVICETSRIQILQHYLVDFEKLHVIYPGIDTDHFNTHKTALDKKLNMPPNSILTVGRMVPAKGVDRVIETVALIKNKIDTHVYVSGGSADNTKSVEEQIMEQNIQDTIKKHRMDSRVHILGYISHDDVLPAYYRSAELFVHAARYEPFGLTTLEAMACGTVPIVSRLAGSREVIIDGLNGFIVDAHERKGLSELILKLLQDEKLRKKIAQNAAFTIQEHYSWDKIIEKFITLYKSLL